MVEQWNCWRSVTLRPLRVSAKATPASALVTPYQFRLVVQEGLSRTPHLIRGFLERPNRRPYLEVHIQLRYLAVGHYRADLPACPDQWLSRLHCQHTHDPQLCIQALPHQSGAHPESHKRDLDHCLEPNSVMGSNKLDVAMHAALR